MVALDSHQRLIKWMYSFLPNYQQQLKIGDVHSERITLKGEMPQRTWLGPYIVLSLINDRDTNTPSFEFTDDVILTEVTD